MNTTLRSEVAALEERLRVAELGPDQRTFDELLADDVVLVAQDGAPFTKAMVVQAHDAGPGQKFTRVDVSELEIVDHGSTAVVTCRTQYHTRERSFTLKMMRVWLRSDGWKIIAAAMHAVD